MSMGTFETGHGQHWVRSYDPEQYEPLTDDELIGLCYPIGVVSRNRHRQIERSLEAMKQLAAAGEVVIEPVGTSRKERRILPSTSSTDGVWSQGLDVGVFGHVQEDDHGDDVGADSDALLDCLADRFAGALGLVDGILKGNSAAAVHGFPVLPSMAQMDGSAPRRKPSRRADPVIGPTPYQWV